MSNHNTSLLLPTAEHSLIIEVVSYRYSGLSVYYYWELQIN